METTFKQSELLKCLKCRLIGKPPVFNLPPPPQLPIEFLLKDAEGSLVANELTGAFLNTNKKKSLILNNKNQMKRCMRVKNILKLTRELNANNKSEESASKNYIISSSSIESTGATKYNDSTLNLSNLTQTQTLILFTVICLFFVIILAIALLFLCKLFKIRKQLHSKQQSLSSSLSSTSTTNTKTNTLNSQLILTPSSSLLVKTSEHQQQKHPFSNLQQLYDSTAQSDSASQASSSNSTNLFYNQLFESTRQLVKHNPNDMSTYHHYLQAVPNSSNLIENHINYKIFQQQQLLQQQPQVNISEYDEINSQSYQYEQQLQNLKPQGNDIYNQYDDTKLFKSSSSTTSSSTSSSSSSKPLILVQANNLTQTTRIVQPILPIINSGANLRNSACFLAAHASQNGGFLILNNDMTTVNKNDLINPNMYYVC